MIRTGRIAAYLGGFPILALMMAEGVVAGPATQLPTVPEQKVIDCSGYASFVAATGVSTNSNGANVNHPGICQLTEYLPTVAGESAADYLKTLSAWVAELPSTTYVGNFFATDSSWPYRHSLKSPRPRVERPYKLKGSVSFFGHACAQLIDFDSGVSAQYQTFRLGWVNNAMSPRSFCVAEATRVNMPMGQGNAGAVANQIVQRAANDLKAFEARTFCGADQRAAESALANALGAEISKSVARQGSSWQAARASVDGTPSSCVPECNVCATTGWAGEITCTIHVTGTNRTVPGYKYDETQHYYVGGTPTVSGTMSFYPTRYVSTGSGVNGSGGGWNINFSQTVDVQVTTFSNGSLSIGRGNIAVDGPLAIVGYGTALSANELEFGFRSITVPAGGRNASVSYSQPVAGGDSPAQAGLVAGTTTPDKITCTGNLTLQ